MINNLLTSCIIAIGLGVNTTPNFRNAEKQDNIEIAMDNYPNNFIGQEIKGENGLNITYYQYRDRGTEQLVNGTRTYQRLLYTSTWNQTPDFWTTEDSYSLFGYIEISRYNIYTTSIKNFTYNNFAIDYSTPTTSSLNFMYFSGMLNSNDYNIDHLIDIQYENDINQWINDINYQRSRFMLANSKYIGKITQNAESTNYGTNKIEFDIENNNNNATTNTTFYLVSGFMHIPETITFSEYSTQNIIETSNYYTMQEIYYMSPEVSMEVIDIPSIMFEVLGMPFSFISQAFNLTIFPNTPYSINFSNIFLAVISILILLLIVRIIIGRLK